MIPKTPEEFHEWCEVAAYYAYLHRIEVPAANPQQGPLDDWLAGVAEVEGLIETGGVGA